MKKGIHPETFKSKVSCACGARFETISVEKEIRVEICSACHPFFTGEHRLVDSAGRVEKFKNRYKKRSKSN